MRRCCHTDIAANQKSLQLFVQRLVDLRMACKQIGEIGVKNFPGALESNFQARCPATLLLGFGFQETEHGDTFQRRNGDNSILACKNFGLTARPNRGDGYVKKVA